jgi:Amt family ammonium transporter
MALGFTCLEAGLVRTKNTATICVKNVALYSLAGIMFYLVGYGFMYNDVSGYIGTPALWNPEAAADPADGYSKMSDWFFQMVFCATAMSIVSGTIAERIKLIPFLIFAIILTGIIYPIQGSWTWGGGWLSEMGFSDFAGSTIVHSVGGWAALTGAIIIGPRLGKYGPNGQVNAIPGSNLPLATIGTFILWFGWFGFNGGSQLALGSAADAAAMANVYVNTNMAACAGLVAALVLSMILYSKTDLTFVLNGALAGLVSITAGPDVATPLQAIIIGAIGGVICTLAIPLLDKLKIDDVVGAISVHLVAGIWGTLAVAIPGLNGSGDMATQIIGIVSIGIFTVVLSTIGWIVLKAIFGLRPTEEEETTGLDISELGMDAYPEFKN